MFAMAMLNGTYYTNKLTIVKSLMDHWQTIVAPLKKQNRGLVSLLNPCFSLQKMNPLGLDLEKKMSKAALAKEVAVRVYQLHGPLGYYRGYTASLAAYVPNSALWWALYTAYQGKIITRYHAITVPLF